MDESEIHFGDQNYDLQLFSVGKGMPTYRRTALVARGGVFQVSSKYKNKQKILKSSIQMSWYGSIVDFWVQ